MGAHSLLIRPDEITQHHHSQNTVLVGVTPLLSLHEVFHLPTLHRVATLTHCLTVQHRDLALGLIHGSLTQELIRARHRQRVGIPQFFLEDKANRTLCCAGPGPVEEKFCCGSGVGLLLQAYLRVGSSQCSSWPTRPTPTQCSRSPPWVPNTGAD